MGFLVRSVEVVMSGGLRCVLRRLAFGRYISSSCLIGCGGWNKKYIESWSWSRQLLGDWASGGSSFRTRAYYIVLLDWLATYAACMGFLYLFGLPVVERRGGERSKWCGPMTSFVRLLNGDLSVFMIGSKLTDSGVCVWVDTCASHEGEAKPASKEIYKETWAKTKKKLELRQ